MEGTFLVSSDTVVGIVGAVILTGAMVAVFYYEAARSDGTPDTDIGEGSAVYTFRFEERSADPVTLVSDETEPQTHALTVPAYTTNVHVEVSWVRDSGPQGALGQALEAPTFSFELKDENESRVAGDEGSSSPLSGGGEVRGNLTMPIRPEITVGANSTADANETLADYIASLPTRAWSVTVVLEDDGDPTMGQANLQHQYSVTVHFTRQLPVLVTE